MCCCSPARGSARWKIQAATVPPALGLSRRPRLGARGGRSEVRRRGKPPSFTLTSVLWWEGRAQADFLDPRRVRADWVSACAVASFRQRACQHRSCGLSWASEDDCARCRNAHPGHLGRLTDWSGKHQICPYQSQTPGNLCPTSRKASEEGGEKHWL